MIDRNVDDYLRIDCFSSAFELELNFGYRAVFAPEYVVAAVP
ncbi:hypothetical protein DFJ67_6817 [Asanoa ferruginea]|uniref:Uncharacterized protein n=1 Tax=Asanoa ferruginea TaxID=53367 RepID=A0A3D9ZUX8_9ACTN|nr:hypothetical protein DFJ67_6817 [Asanoa ferruginea]